jgi:hypothetical protein
MSKLLHQTRKLFGTKGVKKDELGTGVHAQKGSLWDGHLPTAHGQSPKKAVVDEKGIGHKNSEHNEGAGTESTNPAPLPSPHHEIHQLAANLHQAHMAHHEAFQRNHDALMAALGKPASVHHNLDADQGAEN